MNRLTKKIGLVLISSSLVLTGCGRKESEQAEREDELLSANSGSGAPAGAYPSHHNSYVPGVHYYGYGGMRPGPTFSSRSGGSTRGGFGASASRGGG
jgi:hypothetical protein